METAQLKITGMVCDACAGHVEKSLRGVSGVESVRVDRAAGQATVQHAGAEGSDLARAVADAGYEAEIAQGESHE
jgi:copper chaperone